MRRSCVGRGGVRAVWGGAVLGEGGVWGGAVLGEGGVWGVWGAVL